MPRPRLTIPRLVECSAKNLKNSWPAGHFGLPLLSTGNGDSNRDSNRDSDRDSNITITIWVDGGG